MGKRLTKEIFIKRANIIHKNKYDYTLFNFYNLESESKIICPVRDHGIFVQRAHGHIGGNGCPKCYYDPVVLRDNFINKSTIKHNGKYGYDNFIWTGCTSLGMITCSIHGDFPQIPEAHVKGIGCQECIFSSQRMTFDDFIKKANIIHNNYYEYIGLEYSKNKRTVAIMRCHKHGLFRQMATNHLAGNRCKACSSSIKISKKEKLWLSIIGLPDSNECRQIVIQKSKPKIVVDGFDIKTNTVYEFYGDFWHGNPLVYNRDNINTKYNIKFGELYKKTIERENIIKSKGYNLVYIWERDFDLLVKDKNNE